MSETPVPNRGPVPRMRSDGRLTIGQLVDSLHTEFPDLSISKVRYLEERGLIAPQRTPGGYRTYAQADARRLRTILAMQRDEFLPLDVIRERLARGVPSPQASGTPVTSPQGLDRTAGLRREERLIPWDEALEVSGVEEDFMRQLVEFRLVDRRVGEAGTAVFTESDVEAARICGLLRRFGVEPRNLRMTRSAVEREAAVIEQATAPALRSPHPERREQGERQVLDLGALISSLFQLLLLKDMRALVR